MQIVIIFSQTLISECRVYRPLPGEGRLGVSPFLTRLPAEHYHLEPFQLVHQLAFANSGLFLLHSSL